MGTAVNEQAVPLKGIPTGEGLTFEKVWASLQETDRIIKENAERQMKETDRIIKEVAELQKETDRKMKETDRIIKENAEQQKETDRMIKDNARQMGGLHTSFGKMAEHLVAPGIYKRFNELGYHFNAVARGGYEICDEEDIVIAEVDVLLENSDYIMAVEVKAKPHLKDIEHHIKRLKILRENRNKQRDTRKIQGAIAGAIFGSKEKQAAIDAGFFVLEQSGDTVRINVPKGFIPGEW